MGSTTCAPPAAPRREHEGRSSSEHGQPGGGQRARVDVLGVGGAVQGRLRGAPVDFGERVLQELDG